MKNMIPHNQGFVKENLVATSSKVIYGCDRPVILIHFLFLFFPTFR